MTIQKSNSPDCMQGSLGCSRSKAIDLTGLAGSDYVVYNEANKDYVL